MEKLVLAIDQGTTATTALLINQRLEVIDKASTEILPTYPQAGWVDHDLEAIWAGTLATIRDLLRKTSVDPKTIAAIGITNQRETVGAWGRKDGRPYAPAIVWQCRRTSDFCAKLRKRGLEKTIKKKTGLVLDPYFSGSKIHWLLANVPGLRAAVESGNAVFGTIDTFLLFRMSGGLCHATDVSNASRTSLMDLKTLAWDKSLLKIFGVPEKSLPTIRPSSGEFARTKNMGVLPDGIPIAGILGDQQAALFGQLCTHPGDTKCTYGTGAFLMCNTGKKIVYSKSGLLTTVAWSMAGKTSYALEGSAFVAGAAVQWLRDGLGIIRSSSEVEALAEQAEDKDMGDLVFVPSLTGLGAPYWNAEARGLFSGITRGTNKSHIARAALEGIAHQNDDLLSAMGKDLGKKLNVVKVDGGASANNFMMQLQSDLGEIPIQRPRVLETTALGSALAAGLAVGLWKNLDDLRGAWRLEREFHPKMKSAERKKRRARWAQAVARVNLNK